MKHRQKSCAKIRKTVSFRHSFRRNLFLCVLLTQRQRGRAERAAEEGTFRVKRIHREVYPDGLEPLVNVGYGAELGVLHIILYVIFPHATDKVMDHIALGSRYLEVLLAAEVG